MSQVFQSLRYQRCFTLVETMVAAVIFSLGAAASLSILASSIRATQGSLEIEEETTLAIEEMERQRSQMLPEDVGVTSIAGYTRQVEADGCTFAGSALSCSTATACDDTVPACRITVTVTDPNGDTETLSTIKVTQQI